MSAYDDEWKEHMLRNIKKQEIVEMFARVGKERDKAATALEEAKAVMEAAKRGENVTLRSERWLTIYGAK